MTPDETQHERERILWARARVALARSVGQALPLHVHQTASSQLPVSDVHLPPQSRDVAGLGQTYAQDFEEPKGEHSNSPQISQRVPKFADRPAFGLSKSGRRIAFDTRSGRPEVSIVIPVLNAGEYLPSLLASLPLDFEVVVVDGGSTDRTEIVALQSDRYVRLFRSGRQGKGAALAKGFSVASGNLLVKIDADGSTDPHEITSLISSLEAGADIAKGSRFLAADEASSSVQGKRFANRAANFIANSLLGSEFTDITYEFAAFWADVVPIFDLPSPDIMPIDGDTMLWGDGFEIETIISCRAAIAGLKIAEVPSRELAPTFGDSNLVAISDVIRVLKSVNTERKRAARIASVRSEESRRSENYREAAIEKESSHSAHEAM